MAGFQPFVCLVRGCTSHVDWPHAVLEPVGGVAACLHDGDAASGHVHAEGPVGVPVQALSGMGLRSIEGGCTHKSVPR